MYIVVVKRIKDLKIKDTFQERLPDDYPVQCEEFASRDEALKRHPDASIYGPEEMNKFMESKAAAFREASDGFDAAKAPETFLSGLKVDEIKDIDGAKLLLADLVQILQSKGVK